MKKPIILLTGMAMTMSSFIMPATDPSKEVEIAAQKMASQVVSALKKQSAFDYSALYPTLDGFNRMFDETASFYGHNFAAAKEEFEGRYLTQVIPALNKSFEDLVAEGKQKGIDWKTVTLSKVSVLEESDSDTPVELVLECAGAQHVIRFNQTVMMDGQLKVSANVTLE